MANEKINETTADNTQTKAAPKKAAAEKTTGAWVVNVPILNIREKATLASDVLGTLLEGDKVEVVSRTPQGFGKLADGAGYVMMDYVSQVDEQ